tara:strand:+ start:2293 stop:3279 length:987 start_codon:yes stop_codon:yes gene_type:complete
MKINSEKPMDEISKARPNLKTNTIKQYETHLNKLKKIFNSDNYDFLSDPDKVAEKLKDKAYTSRRNTYNAVIVLLMALNHDEKYNELIEKYDKMRNELNTKYDEEMSSGKISEKQKSNFAEYEEVEGMIKKMENEIKSQGLKKKAELTGKDRELLMVYTLYNMLIRIPTRNDMAGQKLISKTQYNKLTDSEKKENNYLVKEKNKMFGVYNEYKTSKKYGEKKIDIPKDLEKILNMYIRKTGKKNGDILFVSSTGNPLSRNMISQLLMKTSKKYLNKSVSTTLMRKIVASHHFGADSEFGKLKKKQEELAEKMGHSTEVMDKVYIKEKE